MSIDDNFRSWNQQSINILQEGPGVYELYREDKTLIYIGESKNMKKRLQDYLDNNFADDSCKRDTKWFKREYNYNRKERRKRTRTFKWLNFRVKPWIGKTLKSKRKKVKLK